GDALLHAARRLLVGAAHGQEPVDLLARDALCEAQERGVRAHRLAIILKELDAADRRDEGDDLNAVRGAEPLIRDGSGGDTGDGLTGAGAAATRRGLDAVLLEVGPVGVGGAWEDVDGGVAVVARALVLVGDGEEDRGAEGAAELGARVDGD